MSEPLLRIDFTAVDAEITCLRQRADRAERILAALREPSEAVVTSAAENYLPNVTTMNLAEMRDSAPQHAALIWCGVDAAIRAAVTAAEKEVDG